jgi:hypothetical protein
MAKVVIVVDDDIDVLDTLPAPAGNPRGQTRS